MSKLCQMEETARHKTKVKLSRRTLEDLDRWLELPESTKYGISINRVILGNPPSPPSQTYQNVELVVSAQKLELAGDNVSQRRSNRPSLSTPRNTQYKQLTRRSKVTMKSSPLDSIASSIKVTAPALLAGYVNQITTQSTPPFIMRWKDSMHTTR